MVSCIGFIREFNSKNTSPKQENEFVSNSEERFPKKAIKIGRVNDKITAAVKQASLPSNLQVKFGFYQSIDLADLAYSVCTL